MSSNTPSGSSFTNFKRNEIHFSSRYHGVLMISGGKNGFRQLDNSTIFFASLEPNNQLSVNYPGAIFNANDNFFELVPIAPNPPSFNPPHNFWLDERNTRLLSLGTTSLFPASNPQVWETAFDVGCGSSYPIEDYTDELSGSQVVKKGGISFTRYSSLSGVLIPCGTYSSQGLISVCTALTDSLYNSLNPDYSQIIGSINEIIKCNFTSQSSLLKELKYELYNHSLWAFSEGRSKQAIFVGQDSISPVTINLLASIDSLIYLGDHDTLPWKNYKFQLKATKAEVHRLSEHRTDAISVLNDALIEFEDSLEIAYLNKAICINNAEQFYLDSNISIDSLYNLYSCFNEELPELPTPYFDQTSLRENDNHNSKNNVLVYPNPGNNQLKISVNKRQSIKEIKIIDMMGVVQKTLIITEDIQVLDLITEDLNSGNYVIHIITNQMVYDVPFVIVR